LKWRAACPYLQDYSFIRLRYEFKTPAIWKALFGTLFLHLQRGRNPSQGLYSLSHFLLTYKYTFLMSRTYWVALTRSSFSLSILYKQRHWKGRFYCSSLSAILIRQGWTNKNITKVICLAVVGHINLSILLQFVP
jgi:hypothetical protein